MKAFYLFLAGLTPFGVFANPSGSREPRDPALVNAWPPPSP